MIHHIDFAVKDFARSREFYVRTLAPLGLALVLDLSRDEGRQLIGFGSLPDPVFWIRSGPPVDGRLHVAFVANSRAAVDEFHNAALQAGGKDNGAPGLRPRYAQDWYAAFVLDPDGHNIEAACRDRPHRHHADEADAVRCWPVDEESSAVRHRSRRGLSIGVDIVVRVGAADHLLLTTLVVTGIVVLLMVYVVMPRYTKLVKRWLFT